MNKWTEQELRNNWKRVFDHPFPLVAMNSTSQSSLLLALRLVSGWSADELEQLGDKECLNMGKPVYSPKNELQ